MFNIAFKTATFAAGLSALAGVSSGYSITIRNNCEFKVWPAATQHNFAGASDFPLLDAQYTGFPLSAGKQKTITVPDHWTGGRIWARTGCDSQGKGNCQVGSCPGGMRCTDYAWTAPTTLAEFGYGGNLGTFYDISVIPGFNVGVQIKPSIGSCATRTCATQNCPADQAYHQSSDNFVDRQCSLESSYTVTFCP